MCTISHAPFRAEAVGSYLRPERLKNSRIAYFNNEISIEELTKIEDEEITNLVEKQIECGLKAVTDGEFRRSWWHLDFMWHLDGIQKIEVDKGYQFKDVETRAESASVVGKIQFSENHPFLAHFEFLNKLAKEKGVTAKQTIPAPAQCYAELVRLDNLDEAKKVYPNLNDLETDLIKAYTDFIFALYNKGCRNLQLDDCTWGMLCDANFWNKMAGEDYDPEELIDRHLALNNAVLEKLPEDLTVNTHVCRGNYKSTWASSGGYGRVAEKLFGKENVNAYYLEFDTDRSGSFEPLKEIPPHKKVVLGLLTSKNPTLEDKELIKARIKEATNYVPLENLYLSPQCGFASTEEGNILTEEEQWNKMKLINEIASEVWGE
ncbi:5-methyltetrahydropteroyltriglutamate--homocysteine S-methyltransferase [Zunongwangia sp.]|uniref:5-methyltetrahydropteroyltriglutamate-- homocysteine S-methyltransferase n=1 Tax=Zunongwangia sp. TaxID=1965325 RepID=UPI003AA92942